LAEHRVKGKEFLVLGYECALIQGGELLKAEEKGEERELLFNLIDGSSKEYAP
tara:strand:+ start:914 stop:1072 length:159 start_codon:yes stop_codon:yes gene_type:complete